jgi:hypothetical protein
LGFPFIRALGGSGGHFLGFLGRLHRARDLSQDRFGPQINPGTDAAKVAITAPAVNGLVYYCLTNVAVILLVQLWVSVLSGFYGDLIAVNAVVS